MHSFILILLLLLPVTVSADDVRRPLNENHTEFLGFLKQVKLVFESEAQPLKKQRRSHTRFENMIEQAYLSGLDLRDITIKERSIFAALHLSSTQSLPKQMGHVARIMHNHAGKTIEEFVLQIYNQGVKGQQIALIRKDFENALLRHHGSSAEIMRHVRIVETDKHPNRRVTDNADRKNILRFIFVPKHFNFTFHNQISPATGSKDLLYRSDVILGSGETYYRGDRSLKLPFQKKRLRFHDVTYHNNLGLRLKLKNNLTSMRSDIRFPGNNPIRGDVDVFAFQQQMLDHWVTGVSYNKDNIHHLMQAGYLDEQFFGVQSEMLYRPYKPNYALGFESSYAMKRDPFTFLGMSLTGDQSWTAFASAHYDLPKYNMRTSLRLGRYLDKDWGGTLSFKKEIEAGAYMEGFATLTNRHDIDNFGDPNNFHTGLRISLPLYQLLRPIKVNSQFISEYKEFGRDTGQFIDAPLNLVDIMDKLDRGHLETYWNRILE